MNITHFGTVEFKEGRYTRQSGSTNWTVRPIDPVEVPVGQVLILFEQVVKEDYSVILTPYHTANSPCLSANYGKPTAEGFLVHLWETIADRTVQNAHFSFAVLQA